MIEITTIYQWGKESRVVSKILAPLEHDTFNKFMRSLNHPDAEINHILDNIGEAVRVIEPVVTHDGFEHRRILYFRSVKP